MKKKVIFIGGVGDEGVFGGELTKNKFIIQRLTEEGYSVKVIDTFGSHSNPFKIAHLPFVILSNLSTPVFFSSRFSNIKTLARLVRLTNKRRRIAFFVTGGRLGREVDSGVFTAKDLSIFDHILVESQSMATMLRDNKVFTAERLPNFKDLSLASFDSSKKNFLADELRCVFMSRIEEAKGAAIILDTLDAIKNSNRNIKIDFYGDIREDFKEKFFLALEAHPNVRYCGRLDMFNGSGQKTLSQYHLFLFPTYFPGEGFPGVLLDAFMSGVPVLASDWLFNPEYISPEIGFLFKSKDQKDFQDKLFDIYDHRERLISYFKACEKEACKYDINYLLTSNLFNRLLG